MIPWPNDAAVCNLTYNTWKFFFCGQSSAYSWFCVVHSHWHRPVLKYCVLRQESAVWEHWQSQPRCSSTCVDVSVYEPKGKQWTVNYKTNLEKLLGECIYLLEFKIDSCVVSPINNFWTVRLLAWHTICTLWSLVRRFQFLCWRA